MILYLIILSLTAITIGATIFFYKLSDKKEEKTGWFVISLFVAIILTVVSICSSIVPLLINSQFNKEDILSEKALIIYKINNNEYENDIDMIEDISKFNKSLIKAKKNRQNKWISWYISKHYETIEPIEYNIEFNSSDIITHKGE